MNIAQANSMESEPLSSTPPSPPRPLLWSVRRELWENRSIYLAPLITMAVLLFGFLMSTRGLPGRRRAVLLLDEAHQRMAITPLYGMAAFAIIVTAFFVGVFYCLDALSGERRDRSILFWKSLPVSDLTTVLSKTIVALVALPLVACAAIIITQVFMALITAVVLLVNGMGTASFVPQLKFFPSPLLQLYSVIVIALWHAPIYGWALLVSGWARRATFLWAVMPLLAIAAIERMAFETTYFMAFLKYRVVGWFAEAFAFKGHESLALDPVTQMTPAHFLSLPALWLGLLFFAICLFAAVRLRRYRGPT